MNTTNEYPPRHIKGFRPIVPGEAWHRLDFTPEMLEDKEGKGPWRPLLLGEYPKPNDQGIQDNGNWIILDGKFSDHQTTAHTYHRRTRRPLPPPPPTFQHDGKTWNSHVPGDPCPVDGEQKVETLYDDGVQYVDGVSLEAEAWNWKVSTGGVIIGYRIPDAEPQDDTAKLRERIAELENALTESDDEGTKALLKISQLEQQLAIALTPRPIAEAGLVKEGFVRLFGGKDSCGKWVFYPLCWQSDTHYLDIRLPSDSLRAEYDRAVAEAGGAFEAWLKAKGGVS